MVELTSDSFDESIKTQDAVLVDFWAEWCSPCKAMNPVLEEAEATSGTPLFKVNAEMEIGLCKRFKVQKVPSLLFLKEGQEVARIVGAAPLGEVLDLLQS
jgi:thioredoxin 1